MTAGNERQNGQVTKEYAHFLENRTIIVGYKNNTKKEKYLVTYECNDIHRGNSVLQ